jgi:hypothetical protein
MVKYGGCRFVKQVITTTVTKERTVRKSLFSSETKKEIKTHQINKYETNEQLWLRINKYLSDNKLVVINIESISGYVGYTIFFKTEN